METKQTAQHKNEEKKKKRRGRKPFLIAAVVLFVLLCLQLFLYYFANPVLRKAIPWYVSRRSAGLYSVQFADVQIIFGKRAFLLTDFKLIPNKKIYDSLVVKNKINAALYSIEIPEFQINGINPAALLYDNSLKIKEINFKKPQANIIGLPQKALTDTTKKYDAINQDLFPFILKYVDRLKINKISVNNGFFDFYYHKSETQQTFLKSFTIGLYGFDLSDKKSSTKEMRILHSDGFEIFLNDYQSLLADSIHILSAERLHVSTLKSEIYAKSIKLKPRTCKDGKSETKDLFDLELPEIKISQLDFTKAFFDKKLKVSSLKLPNLKIKYYNKSPKSGKFKVDSLKQGLKANDKLYNLIKGNLHSVDLDTFILENASIDLFEQNMKMPQLSAKSFTVKLKGFFLDSMAAENKDKILYADDIEMEMNKFKMKLKDDLHTFKCKTFSVSTASSKIYANEIEFFPKNHSKSLYKKSNFDIYIPYLTISDIDMKAMFNYKKLPIRLLHITQPMLNIVLQKPKKRKENTKQPFLEILSNYFKQININKFRIDKGIFNIEYFSDSTKTGFTNGRIDMQLSDFSFDKNSSTNGKRLFFAKNAKISFQDYVMKANKNLHVLEIADFYVSTFDSLVRIDGLRFKPQNAENYRAQLKNSPQDQVVDFSVENILIQKTNIAKAYFSKKSKIHSLKIEKPALRLLKFTEKTDDKMLQNRDKTNAFSSENKDSIFLNKLYTLSEKYFHSIKINDFAVANGNFHYQIFDEFDQTKLIFANRFNIRTNNFSFHKDSLFNENNPLFCDCVASIELLENKLEIAHKISASIASVEYTKKNKGFLCKNARISSLGKDDKKNRFCLEIPLFSLQNTNLQKMLWEKKLFFDALKIKHAALSFYKAKKNTENAKSKRTADFPSKLSNFIKEAQIGLVDIDDFSLKYFIAKNKLDNPTFKTKLNIAMDSLNFACLDNDFEYNFATFALNAQDFAYYFPDSLHTLFIKNITNNKKKTKFTVSDFHIRPKKFADDFQRIFYLKQADKSLISDVFIPKISLVGLNINSFFEHRKLALDSLFMDSLNINIANYLSLKRSKDSEKIFDKLFQKLRSVSVDYMNFSKGLLSYTVYDKEDTRNFFVDDVSGNCRNFYIDSLSVHKDNRLFYADDFKLKLKDYEYDIPNSYYRVSAEEIGISSAQKQMYVDSFYLFPFEDKRKLASKLDFRRSFFDFFIPQIRFDNFDFFRLINHKQLHIGKTSFVKPDIQVYKDKRLPFNYTLRPKMPLELLYNAPIFVQLDSVLVEDALVFYEEQRPQASRTGKFTLEKLSCKMFDFTNDSAIYEKRQNAKIFADAYVMGNGHLNVNFDIPLGNPDGKYFWHGNLDSMQLSTFNPLVENIAFVSIKDGNLKQMTFEVESSNDTSKGEMKLYFNDLKIKILKRDSITQSRGFSSFFANRIIKSDNPRKSFYPIRVGKIFYERNISRSIFHFWLSSLVTGVKSSLGFNSREIKEEIKKEKEVQKRKEKELRANMKVEKKSQKIDKKNTKRIQRHMRKYRKKDTN